MTDVSRHMRIVVGCNSMPRVQVGKKVKAVVQFESPSPSMVYIADLETDKNGAQHPFTVRTFSAHEAASPAHVPCRLRSSCTFAAHELQHYAK